MLYSLLCLAQRASKALPVNAIFLCPHKRTGCSCSSTSPYSAPATRCLLPGTAMAGLLSARTNARSSETCRKPRRAYTPSPAGVACSVAVFLPSRAAAASMPRSSALASPRRRCSSCSRERQVGHEHMTCALLWQIPYGGCRCLGRGPRRAEFKPRAPLQLTGPHSSIPAGLRLRCISRQEP